MKVEMIRRNPDDYLRDTKKDIHKMPRNYDPKNHPFAESREYTLALNAVKLERVFAKPFLGSLNGHRDAIHTMCKHPQSLSTLLTGSCDGEIRLWNLPKKECVRAVNAHDGFVRGLCFNPSGNHFFSCGDDKLVKRWNMESATEEPVNVYVGKEVFWSMDHHWTEDKFATCGHQVAIYDEEKRDPISCYVWDHETTMTVKFNPIETDILAATSADRGIILYDIRQATALRKMLLTLKANALAWNPLEAMVFTAASEDYNLYSYDMRRLDRALNVHKDHVASVLDVDYSPTGKEFVSGSYDKTIRIFPCDKGHSRDIYHTKRMQRVTCVRWTLDNSYILSGSDEMNVRVWKAKASEKLGLLRPRERDTFEYNEKLKDRFKHHPEVRRIARHRHVPKAIYTAQREHSTIHFSQKRKEANRRRHSKKGAVPFAPARQKHIISEIE